MYTDLMQEQLLQAGFKEAGRNACRMLYKPLNDRLTEIKDRKRQISEGFLYASAPGSHELASLEGEEKSLTAIMNAVVMANKEESGDK